MFRYWVDTDGDNFNIEYAENDMRVPLNTFRSSNNCIVMNYSPAHLLAIL